MSQHVVVAHGDTISHPYIVATESAQWRQLVSMALADPCLADVSARTHHRVTFHVQDPAYRVKRRPKVVLVDTGLAAEWKTVVPASWLGSRSS
jgi:hypothetical protein